MYRTYHLAQNYIREQLIHPSFEICNHILVMVHNTCHTCWVSISFNPTINYSLHMKKNCLTTVFRTYCHLLISRLIRVSFNIASYFPFSSQHIITLSFRSMRISFFNELDIIETFFLLQKDVSIDRDWLWRRRLCKERARKTSKEKELWVEN